MFRKLLIALLVLAAAAVALVTVPAPASGLAALAPTATTAATTVTAQATVNVNIRSGPSTAYSIVGSLQGGQLFYISCYVSGQSINGDSIWYLGKPNPYGSTAGYVAGYYLTTGHDPNPNVTHC